ERERLTVNAILDALLDFYAVQGHRSVASAGPTVKAWRSPLGVCRALAVTTGRILRLTRAWQASGTSNATINRRLALLHRAYRLAELPPDPARAGLPGRSPPGVLPARKAPIPGGLRGARRASRRRPPRALRILLSDREAQGADEPHHVGAALQRRDGRVYVERHRSEGEAAGGLAPRGPAPRAHRGALRGAPSALPLRVSRARLCGGRGAPSPPRMRWRLQAALRPPRHAGRLRSRSPAWRLRLSQHPAHGRHQPRQRRRPGARSNGGLRSPDPQCVRPLQPDAQGADAGRARARHRVHGGARRRPRRRPHRRRAATPAGGRYGHPCGHPPRRTGKGPQTQNRQGCGIISGAEESRTPDLLNAIQALSQLSYGPTTAGSAPGRSS